MNNGTDLERRLERSLRLADKRGRREVKDLTERIAKAHEQMAKLHQKIEELNVRLAKARVSVSAEELRLKLEGRLAK